MSDLVELIEHMPRGATIYKGENKTDWQVLYPTHVPNYHNAWKKFYGDNLVTVLEQAALWFEQRPTKRAVDGACAHPRTESLENRKEFCKDCGAVITPRR